MVVEDKLKSKLMYKIELILLKILPILMVICAICNSILSYFDIDLTIFSYIGGVSLLPLIFFYLSSYVFKFCEYHRMFLHYITISDCINWLDYFVMIPISDINLLILLVSLFGMTCFIALFMFLREKGRLQN